MSFKKNKKNKNKTKENDEEIMLTRGYSNKVLKRQRKEKKKSYRIHVIYFTFVWQSLLNVHTHTHTRALASTHARIRHIVQSVFGGFYCGSCAYFLNKNKILKEVA